MTHGINSLLANGVSLVCVLMAGWLCERDKHEWRWFLLVALMCSVTLTYRSQSQRCGPKP